MNNPSNHTVWQHERVLRAQLEKKFIEQEIHRDQQARQTWFQLEDKNNRYFQTMPQSGNIKTQFEKIKDEHDNWFEDQ